MRATNADDGIRSTRDKSTRLSSFGERWTALFIRACEEIGFKPSRVQLERFQKFHQLLTIWNQRINLTRIIEPTRVAIEHFVDSIIPIKYHLLPNGISIVDIGTGAGFPGIPIAIACPDVAVTLIDATRKKVQYLQAVCDELALSNVEIIWGRAEDIARHRAYRESFDRAVVRAFGSLDVVIECALPFVRIGGCLIAYKGPRVHEEINRGQRAAEALGGRVTNLFTLTLPATEIQRTLVIVEKVQATPLRYPRRAGIPAKRPLADVL